MMAKKKKGPAADALAQLEALEAEMEPTPVAVEERPILPANKKKKKKKGPKGAAADALAQLEELEAGGTSNSLSFCSPVCAPFFRPRPAPYSYSTRFLVVPLWVPSETHNSSCRTQLKFGVKLQGVTSVQEQLG